MNKGYAFGFLLVLAVVILGFYVAMTSFRSIREARLAEPSSTPNPNAARPTRSPTPATATTTQSALSSPVPGITATIAVTITAATTPLPEPTQGPGPAESSTPAPPDASATVAPTQTPLPVFEYRVAGPPAPDSSVGSCCYLLGTVRDVAGTGLEGVQVWAKNEWNPPVIVATKGGVDLGQYNIPVGASAITWYVQLVDAAGKPISTQASVQFDPSKANAIRIDWKRNH